MFVRIILHLTESTTKPVLTLDQYAPQDNTTKLTLAYYVCVFGEDNLAGQIYREQLLRAGQG